MTSGSFHSIEISSITVPRETRQRREINDIPSLADSIRRLGLIHPIVVTDDLILVAGERRLAACQSLGWTHINCQHTSDLSGPELRAIELEENIKRKDIPWEDRCLAVKEYHELRRAEESGWSQESTGKALGIEQNTVSKQILVAEALAKTDPMVSQATNFSTALGIITRRAERRKAAELESFAAVERPEVKHAESILPADFRLWAPSYSGPRFNLIHCDFPYGIGAQDFVQGAARKHGGYDDSEDTYWSLCNVLADNLERLCTESCHIVFWFSMWHYTATLKFFAERTNFDLDPFPLVWLKSDNSGIIPDPERGPRRIYEVALFGSRGDRKVVRCKSNAYAAPSVKDDHMSIKPEPMLKHFLEMFVDENTVMLDPTCGSGSALRAAEALGAKTVLGLEMNEEFADRAKLTLAQMRRLRAVT